jgi:hypothetical protein
VTVVPGVTLRKLWKLDIRDLTCTVAAVWKRFFPARRTTPHVHSVTCNEATGQQVPQGKGIFVTSLLNLNFLFTRCPMLNSGQPKMARINHSSARHRLSGCKTASLGVMIRVLLISVRGRSRGLWCVRRGYQTRYGSICHQNIIYFLKNGIRTS